MKTTSRFPGAKDFLDSERSEQPFDRLDLLLLKHREGVPELKTASSWATHPAIMAIPMISPGPTFQSKVTDIRLESRSGIAARWQIALDRTLFSSAASTGTLVATAPSGARIEVPVLGVHEEDGTIWHLVAKPLTEGTEVLGTLTGYLA